MFSRKLLPIVIMVMSFFACGVLPEQNTFETFSNTVELGVLGNKKKSIYKTNFEVSSIPYYKNKKLKLTFQLFLYFKFS